MTGAGDLRERVVVRRQVVAPDGQGGAVRSWVDGVVLRAEVRPTRPGDALAIAEAVQQFQGYRIRTHWRRDIGIETRLAWNGLTLKVLAAVDETGRRQWLTIYTDSGVVVD